jgi:hypothetical protein
MFGTLPPLEKPARFDIVLRFHEVLILSIEVLQMKRNEIKQLHSQLLDRDNVIQTMKQQEAVYLAQTDNFKVSWKIW